MKSAASQRRKTSRSIYKFFTKLNGLHLQSDAASFLEKHFEDQPDIDEALSQLAKAYKKQFTDENMFVKKNDLESLITSLNNVTPSRIENDINSGIQDMTIDDGPIDITQHFHVVNAFDMPRMYYDIRRKGFVKYATTPSLMSTPKEKSELYRDRLQLVKQRVLRDEHFDQSSSSQTIDPDSSSYLKITPIKALIGRDREHFLLFGMLTQLEDGKVFLEDEDANVQLDLSQCAYTSGFFTDHTFVLVEGLYGDDHVFHVYEMGFPPAEPRTTSENFTHVDFLDLQKPTIDKHRLKAEEESNEDVFFAIISDVHLDEPMVIPSLRRVFERYSSTRIPLAFILIGNFSRQAFSYTGQNTGPYKDSFTVLADLIFEFQEIASNSYFIFVPGCRDPWGGLSLPQPALPEFLTSRVQHKVRRAIFTSNPCRIRYCTQDIVVYREDLFNALSRNALLAPRLEEDEEPSKHLIRTIIDQGHLSPLPLTKRPIYWAYDHSMRLYPLPHALILADECETFGVTYQGTHCLNPGSFPNSSFSWREYFPAKQTSEKW
ncbi:hypothetical protein O0I10_010419 [Lichtheimia ornata]|uniref:DNA polymerase epsilon subunit n=1 Tax=Lichtheimia ornata TaxID=688661 RepID=A0AAD7UWS9_9FUNG|nr:uncharacterized protein O0I10_010419 [Lichtheimia ornata]KAJ8653970.1 hypothetical protein O0I10_010419 [Lichtheimia ornata]